MRDPGPAAAACFAMAASCVFAAAQIDAPARIGVETLKPPPSGPDSKLGPIFEREFQKRFPGIFEEKVNGTNVVVALINRDLTISKVARIVSTEKQESISESSGLFELIGLKAADVPYMAIMGLQSPKLSGQTTMVVYTESKTPGKPFVSEVFPDTRAVDREIVKQHFPDVLKNGLPGGNQLWVLLDRQGRVLRAGMEIAPTSEMAETLRRRFAGIKPQESVWSPVVDGENTPLKGRGGGEIQLWSVWLAPDSPLPRNR